MADYCYSLLQNESILGHESAEQTKGLERGYPETPGYDKLDACIYKELEDAGDYALHGISNTPPKTPGASHGREGAVDDGRLQCKRYVLSMILGVCSYLLPIPSSKRSWNILSHHYIRLIRPVGYIERLYTRHRDRIHNHRAPWTSHPSCKHDHDDCTTSCRLTRSL